MLRKLVGSVLRGYVSAQSSDKEAFKMENTGQVKKIRGKTRLHNISSWITTTHELAYTSLVEGVKGITTLPME